MTTPLQRLDQFGFESVPVLVYSTASVVSIQNAAGRPSVLTLRLSDSGEYAKSSPLTVDLSASGRGGLDTGSEANSTWYYIYAIPSTTAGELAAVASVTSPATGPTGFSPWRYLGAVRNDGSGNIIKFSQNGNRFDYYARINGTASAGLGTTRQDPKVTLSMTDVVPDTASRMICNGKMQHGASGGYAHIMELFVDGETGVYAACWADSSGYIHADLWVEIPMPTSPKQIGYRSYNNGSGDPYGQWVYTMGWIDGYLSPSF